MRLRNLYAWAIVFGILIIFLVGYIISLNNKLEAPVSQPVAAVPAPAPEQSQLNLNVQPVARPAINTGFLAKPGITIVYAPEKKAEELPTLVEQINNAKKAKETQLQPGESAGNGEGGLGEGQSSTEDSSSEGASPEKPKKRLSSQEVQEMRKQGIVIF